MTAAHHPPRYDALIIGEANNHGISFHGRLMTLEYPNIYFRTTSEETVNDP